jgi:hypothetical protein
MNVSEMPPVVCQLMGSALASVLMTIVTTVRITLTTCRTISLFIPSSFRPLGASMYSPFGAGFHSRPAVDAASHYIISRRRCEVWECTG